MCSNIFFFKQKTAYEVRSSDWSSDVCSSDLLKGLMVLETVSKLDGRAHTLDEIAKVCGLSRSDTHRTLQTLAHGGYVVRDQDTGSYRTTLKMFELGARQLSNMAVRAYAPSFMRALAIQTGETVPLSVLAGLAEIGSEACRERVWK